MAISGQLAKAKEKAETQIFLDTSGSPTATDATVATESPAFQEMEALRALPRALMAGTDEPGGNGGAQLRFVIHDGAQTTRDAHLTAILGTTELPSYEGTASLWSEMISKRCFMRV